MMEIIQQYYIVPVVAMSAFLLTYFAMPAVIDVSHLKGLFDDSENSRKRHIGNVPNLGGIGLFASVLIVFTLSGYAVVPWSASLIAGLSILFFSGLKDDIYKISAYKKLFLQVAAIAVVMIGGQLVITDLGGVFGGHEIPLWAGLPLTFFTMIVVVNAYNLIDGVDGLAGGIGVIASLFFGWWFWSVSMTSHAILAFALMGSLLAFLKYNFQPASIFMGDTGSQVVGYLLAFLVVSFVQTGIATAGSVPFGTAVPVLALAVLIVPLYDTLRVFTVRALRKESPFKADRRHVHHRLIDFGFSHRATCVILFSYTVGIMALTMLLAGTEINLLLGIMLVTTILLFPTAGAKRKLLAKMGIEMPSQPQIQAFEMKYGMPANTIGTKKDAFSVDEEEDSKEIAV